MIKIAFFHNIMWSKYRISVFNRINKCSSFGVDFVVYQMALTERSRTFLAHDDFFSSVEHKFNLLSQGSYDDLSVFRKFLLVFKVLLISKSNLFVITGYSSIESWLVFIYCLLFRKSIIVTVDSSCYELRNNFIRDFLKRFLICNVDAVLVYGSSSRVLVNLLGRKDGVFSPFHCVDDLFYLDLNLVLEKKSTKSSCPFTFLFVGRLAQEKGILELITDFCEIFGGRSDIVLKVVGGGSLHDECIAKTISYGVSNVVMQGPLTGTDLVAAYIDADCLVLPSFVEPWGLVVNEALCVGTPVVVSNKCGCLPDLVQDNRHAVVCDVLESSDLKRALIVAYEMFSGFDVERVKECVQLGQYYSSERAADTFFKALKAIEK